MTIAVPNTSSNTETFGTWLIRTNLLATIASQNAVTVDSTLGGSLSTGNGYVNGYFGSNTLFAYTGIAGGNLTSGSTLNLLTNTAFVYSGSNLASFNANSTYSNAVITTNSIYIVANGGNVTIGGNYLNINANVINVTSNSFNYTGVTTFTGNSAFKANGTFSVLTIAGNNTVVSLLANTTNTSIVGNVYLSNTLNVTGAASFSNTLAVTGNVTFSNTLAVTGNATFSNTMSIAGNANIGGNLGVVGNANVGGNLGVIGNLSVSGNINFTGVSTGDFNPQSNLTFSLGNTSFYWLNAYISSLTLANTASIAGNATFSSRITVTGNATFSNVTSHTGAATFSNTIAVTGNATFSNVVTITGNATFSNVTTHTGAATFSNTLTVTGVTTLSSNAAVTGRMILNSIGHQFANSYTFTNSTVAANIDTISVSTYRSMEYTVQLVDSTITPNPYYHVTKISIIHDGTTPYLTEYGTLYNIASLGSFDALINGGNIALQLTPTTANVVAKFIRTSIVP
jgi:hypothetical protein